MSDCFFQRQDLPKSAHSATIDASCDAERGVEKGPPTVDTGTAKLGITADHVYAKYLEEKAQVEDMELQLGGNTINIEDYLIDRDGRLDIATFRMPDPFVGALDAYFHTSLSWPVQRVAKGEAIIHGGYPQVLRDRKTGEVDFGFQYFASAVNEATDDAITIYPPEDAYWPENPGATLNRSFGGQSGGRWTVWSTRTSKAAERNRSTEWS